MGRKAGLTSEDVIVAAQELVDRDGLENLTLARLAADLGIASPSLYNHIAGLDDLRRQLAIRANQRLAAGFAEATEGLGGEPALLVLCDAYRDFARQHPGQYNALLASTATADDEELLAARKATLEPILQRLAGVGFVGEAQWEAIRILRASIHGFLQLELTGSFGFPPDVETSYHRMIEAIFIGLREVLIPPDR